MAGVAGAPQFAFGQSSGGKTFIKVFMRGGADGLHLFPAIGDPMYYQHRPNIAIEAPLASDGNTALDIGDSYRGMNPNLQPLMDIWDAGRMMVAPSTAIDEGNRSHFDNQRWIGKGAADNTIDGYINRYMLNTGGATDPLRGAVLGRTSSPAEMRGDVVVPVVSDQDSFNLENDDFCSGTGCADNQLTELMRDIASHPVIEGEIEASVRENQLVMLESIAEVQNAGTNYVNEAGDDREYSTRDIGKGLKLTAQLLKAGVPLEVAAMDWNIGWDSHSNQISTSADRFTDQSLNYHSRMLSGANDFLTFFRDMGDAMDNIVVLVCTEFGRTVIENGSQGTDHGHGTSWFAFGGPTAPGVGPDITSLATDQLLSNRYVPTVTNYKDIVAEIMIRHMGMTESLVSTVFPGHTSFTNHNLFSRFS